METEEIKALMKLIGAAESIILEIKGKRIALGPDMIAEILAALEHWEDGSKER